ncbi:hypothetical protein [Parvularcula mediterranea]|uniref:hypothetical protein n=1 Tax=Parvularcula mediterranea TaxID=2732508 RepID=UPI001566B70A|nr:hypothetical protein [Parvularcula mediterranea]
MTQAEQIDDFAASIGTSRSSRALDLRWSDALAFGAMFLVGMPAILLAHEGRWLLAVPIYLGLLVAMGAYWWAEHPRPFGRLPFIMSIATVGAQFIAQIWIE